MANTLEMAFTNIAQRGISTFGKPTQGVGMFTTDYSADIFDGTSVDVRVVPLPGAPVDSSVGYDHDSVAPGAAVPKINVPLSIEKVLGFDISDDELLKNSGAAMTDTIMRLTDGCVNGLAYYWNQFVYGKILAASYANSINIGEKAAFDSDNGIDIVQALKETYNFPVDANTVFNSGYIGSLLKDPAIKNQEKSNLPTLINGAKALGTLAGMSVFEAVGLPENGQKLVGFGCAPSAMAVAMRGKGESQIGSAGQVERIEIMEDPITKAILTAYMFRISGKRKWRMTFELWGGAVATYTGALVRFVKP